MITSASKIQGEVPNRVLSSPFSSQLSGFPSPSVSNNPCSQKNLTDAESTSFHVPTDPSLVSDASIFDICESAPGVFWAVGDRGSVWRSSDNGDNWYLVKVPTSASLRAVAFSDELNGLIVGGRVLPGTSNGKGVILRTVDGGRSWDHVDTTGIPCLHDLQFGRDGIAEVWGDSSELYPSGYFTSTDGGQTWDSPFRTARHFGWKRGNMTPSFAGLDKMGIPVRFERSRVVPVEGFPEFLSLTDFVIADKFILFVGHSGTVFHWSEDKRPGQFQLPDEARDFDFETISVSGDAIYLAGNPGTKVFSSNDAGRTWHVSQTGMTVPIRKLFAAGENTVLGVGDFGTIIVSRDGGISWQIKREGGRRAAWLGLFEGQELIPYQWIVSLSLKEGWLGVADVLTPTDSVSKFFDEISTEFRSREAFIAAGGSSLAFESGFRSPPTELKLSLNDITGHWITPDNEPPKTALRRRLVRMIRTWRPDLILLSEKNEPQSCLTPAIKSLVYDLENPQSNIRPVTGYESKKIDPVKLALMVDQQWDRPKNLSFSQNGLSPLSQMLRNAVLDAVADAADPGRFPDQIYQLGLSPWNVRRIGVATEKGLSMTVKSGEYLSNTGESVDEVVVRAKQIAGLEQDSPVWRGLELVANAGNDEIEPIGNLSSPLGDFDAPRGSASRRLQTINPANRESSTSHIQQRRRLVALVDRLATEESNLSDIFRTNLNELLDQVDRETAAEALFRAGKKLIDGGAPDSGCEYFERLVASYPETIEARPAASSLLRYYAGIERVGRNSIGNPVGNSIQSISSDSLEEFRSKANLHMPTVVDHASDAIRIGELIRNYYPELYMTDDIRFPLAAAQRRAGQIQKAVGYYFNRSEMQAEGDIVALHASAEYALLNGSFENEKISLALPVGKCNPTTVIPYLDGELEPEVWSQADNFSLVYGKGTVPETNIYLLNGKEFLFIAIVARDNTSSDSASGTSRAPRMRDGDMTNFDRVEIALDPDRDFCGFYQLGFDCRGWISESCCGDLQWNPQIYAAHKKTHFGWVLEAAIPWKEFCDASPSVGNVWGISIRRILPGTGFCSWNDNSALPLKDGFGYVRF